MIKLSSEGYCIEAHKVGANTSALKFFIESYASSKGGWKGPLTWMATAFYPAINAMAYRRPLPPPLVVQRCFVTLTRYLRCAPEDIAWFAALVAPASHQPPMYVIPPFFQCIYVTFEQVRQQLVRPLPEHIIHPLRQHDSQRSMAGRFTPRLLRHLHSHGNTGNAVQVPVRLPLHRAHGQVAESETP